MNSTDWEGPRPSAPVTPNRSPTYWVTLAPVARVFSGIQPSGNTHLGNLLGAMLNWVKMQHVDDAIFCVVDLHAITTPQDPATLRQSTLELSQMLLAVGLDPDQCILFAQSQVAEHNQLAWMLECTVSYGELSRMTQFKEKSDKAKGTFVSGGLFTYPALMAADILLYDTNLVPVGDDQRQHIEITRDVATRFNSRYGDTFVMPEGVIPTAGARVMDLQHPENKMSKSADGEAGTVLVLDDLKAIEKKFKRAVTDSDNEVSYDPKTKPGVANLLSILGGAIGKDPADVANDYQQYGALKVATAEAVIELVRPIQERYAELAADPAETERLIAKGADKAREIAAPTYARARKNIGFL